MKLSDISPLQKARNEYQPKLPSVFRQNGPFVKAIELPEEETPDTVDIQKHFPNIYGAPSVKFEDCSDSPGRALNVGMIFSGGQAPGGHNVAAGLFDALKTLHPESALFGFLGGPSGLLENKYQILDDETINAYRNSGGFDMIGSGRTKLENQEQFAQVAATCREHQINALVIIGGDDSNTNACMLADYFMANNIDIKVVGCPKTIDGDLKNRQIQTSFGFDTATKVYSEMIGNIERDAASARKYWHFIKLMGRSASHIALECALQTHPSITLISEEVAAKKTTLDEISNQIADTVRERAAKGLNFGIVLVPEGLIEFIPEIKALIADLNELLAENEDEFNIINDQQKRIEFVTKHLGRESEKAFSSLPDEIKSQLLMDRDPHGNVQVSRIETEKMLIQMVEERIEQERRKGNFKGKFSAQSHFFGYEGRCAAPSNFDADYCYNLGYTAACLAANGKTGYIAAIRNLEHDPGKWLPSGAPLTGMMNIERRKGKDVPVLRKALVDLHGAAFAALTAYREQWRLEDHFASPGPIQYFGPAEITDAPTLTLRLEAEEAGPNTGQ